jgi:hypothetical protein
MATIGSLVTGKTIQLLTGASGINLYLGQYTQDNGRPLAPLQGVQIRAQNVPPEIADKSSAMQFPSANVYCERIVNSLTEKFRMFSGTVQTTVELRHSQDRLEGLQNALENYTDAVLQVLAGSRGDWGDGMFFSGACQIVFTAVKQGGKNFQQVAKVSFEIGVSIS